MPKVAKKKFSYTEEGKASAKKYAERIKKNKSKKKK